MPFSLEQLFARFRPMSPEQRVRRVFDVTTRIFAIDGDDKIYPEILKYRRQIEPTTGIMKQLLIARAMDDLAAEDGFLITKVISLGEKHPLAAFLEQEVEISPSQFIVLTLYLNREAKTYHYSGSKLGCTPEDSFAIADALVKAAVALAAHRQKGDEWRILPRNQVTAELLAIIQP